MSAVAGRNDAEPVLACLQAGRALAALAVLAFHLSLTFGDPIYGGHALGQALTDRGRLGVDFFFVLSGFIILHAHARDIGRPERLGRYAWRRFARIYPIYWIYAGGFCVLLLLGFGRLAEPPKDLASWISAFSLVRVSPDGPPLHVAWTLFHEVAFYAAFSLLILNRWVGVAALAAWAASCLIFYRYLGDEVWIGWPAYISAYNLQFFAGMGAYGLYRRGRDPALLLAAGVLLLGLAIGLHLENGRTARLLFGGGFGLLAAGASILERQGRLKSPKLLVQLGGASYSLYLIHVPVAGFLLRLAGGLRLTTHVPLAAMYWPVFLGTVAVAWLAWLALERPLQRLLRPRGGPGPATAEPMAEAR